MKRPVIHLLVVVSLVVWSGTWEPRQRAMATSPPVEPTLNSPPAEPTLVSWKRSAAGRIEVEANARAPRLKEATETLQSVADRLDCLRTHIPHVRWTRLQWSDGRVLGFATADSAIYGNVALLAVRDLLPGRSTAGSGVQAIRTRKPEGAYRVKILVGAPRHASKRDPAVAPPGQGRGK